MLARNEDSCEHDAAAIERRRKELGVSVALLEREAGLCFNTYNKTRRRKKGGLTRSLSVRLRHALARLSRSEAAGGQDRMVDLVFRLCVAIAALEAGRDAAFVFAHDPSRRATMDPEWLQASVIRERALYIANACVGLQQAELARAAGMTKAAVSLAMKRVEDSRDDAGAEKLFLHIEKAITE